MNILHQHLLAELGPDFVPKTASQARNIALICKIFWAFEPKHLIQATCAGSSVALIFVQKHVKLSVSLFCDGDVSVYLINNDVHVIGRTVWRDVAEVLDIMNEEFIYALNHPWTNT